jgi:hypothetical protein
MRNRFTAVVAVVALALFAAAPAAANHGPLTDHLPPSNANVDLVAKLRVSNIEPGAVADVATYRDTAFLAAWTPKCNDAPNFAGGFWSIDIRNPSAPRELTFVASPRDTYLTEGMHAMRMTTPAFSGDVLVVSQEPCNANGHGGFALYDVSNPAAPVRLTEAGDTGVRGPLFNSAHSAFGWDTGPNAYVGVVDNDDRGVDDIDIFDVTDPRNPRMLAEIGIGDWPAAQDNLAYGEQANVHDLVVRRVEGKWEMLASYWDVGYVRLDVTNPASPTYISDSDYPATDPLVPGIGQPEGNGHEAEFDRCPEEGVRSRFACGDVRYVLAADEDFSVSRPTFRATTGPNAGNYGAGEFSWTVPLETKFAASGGVAEGPTRFGGSGCMEDLNGNGTPDRNDVPPAATLPAAPGEEKFIVFERGTCFFSIKTESGQLAGYDVVLIANHHSASGNGLFPNGFTCGSQGHAYTPTSSALCIGHRAMHLLFNDPVSFTGPSTGSGADVVPIGTQGANVRVQGGVFDGWGYLNLINADTMQHIDHYAVPEAIDERFERGFGDLTIHEITTDPTGDVGYIAWYAAGFRVVDYSGGDLREVGHYIDTLGNDIWGVELNVRRDGRLFALGSDRDYGLYIYRFGTDLQVASTNARGRVGRPMTLRSTVRNDGTIAETNAKWSMRLPRGVRLRSAFASQGRCSVTNRQVNCNLGNIAEGGRAGIVLRLVSSRAGTRRSETLIAGRKAEYDVGNNSDRVALRVRAAAGAAGAGAGGALTGRP